MSYIYEALKRAEDEREHGAVTVRTVARPLVFAGRARWWVWAVMGGLALNAGLLVVLVANRWPQPPAAPVAVVVPATRPVVRQTPPAVRETPPAVPDTPPVVAAPRPAPRREVTPPAPRVEPKPEIVVPPPPQVAEPERTAPTPIPAPQPAVVPEPVPPRVHTPLPAAPEPPAVATEAALDLKLQVHVYSVVASERMVFIAGRRYGEGDAIDADTVLERITPNGAVVRRRGQRFELSDRRP